MRFLVVALVILKSLLIITCEKARFDNYRVYSMQVENEKQLEVLQELEKYPDGLIFSEAPFMVSSFAELVVPPHKLADITDFLDQHNSKYDLKNENLQRLIDAEQPASSSRATFGWRNYYDLSDIYKWLDQMLKQYPGELMNFNIGISYEKRPIRAVRLSRKSKNPTIFIESGIHAREWISVATSTYILNELLTSDDPEIRQLSENFDWVFVPVINVDGYEYTHTKNRLWRKSRSRNSIIPYCYGVDPNRNFGFHHAEVGSSSNPCSDVYAGPRPFSEPEIESLASFIKSFDNIKLYLSFHAYGLMLLFPYGHSKQHPKNYDYLYQIGMRTKESIRNRYGTEYTVGNIAETIYLVSGNSIDWAYATQNISLAYTFELRDSARGRYGFLLPANFIIPNSIEIIDGLKSMIKKSKSLGYF